MVAIPTRPGAKPVYLHRVGVVGSIVVGRRNQGMGGREKKISSSKLVAAAPERAAAAILLRRVVKRSTARYQ